MDDSRFRLDFVRCSTVLRQRLDGSVPRRIQLLAGPRQVGKTTILLGLLEQHAPAALYVAADGPEAAVPGFWDRIWTQAEDLAVQHGQTVVLLDEVHLLPDWCARLKGEWDRLRRRKRHVHVVATGSSALRFTEGTRESLAGRFERLTLTHWSARSLSEVFGVQQLEAAAILVRQGAYPGAFDIRNDADRWTAYVRDAILDPAIGRDILALASVRKPALLRQVFGVCALSPSRIVSLQKIQGQLQDAGALETIAHYLQLLEEAFLVAALGKHTAHAPRQRAAPPKIVVLSNALLAVSDPRGAPDPEADPARYGFWVENACLAHAWNAGQRVSYWREEPYEVDGVIDGSWGSWAIEVKTGHIGSTELRGLAEFTKRHPRYRPLVLCDIGAEQAVERLGLSAQSWPAFLLSGPPTR